MARRAAGIAGMVALAASTLAALVPASGATAQTGGVVTTDTFRMLTYNVAGLPEPLSSSDSDVNSPLISPKLNGYDLVLLQEDWADPVPPLEAVDFHHDDITSAVTHPHRTSPAPNPFSGDPRRPSALVSDGLNALSVFPLGPPDRQMWAGCFGGLDTADGGAGDCLALKGFFMTRLTLANGVEVDLYDLHGEAGGTATDQQLQADDYAQLAAYVQTHSAGRAVILAGDTNLHTDGTHPDASGTADRDIWEAFQAATGLSDVCDVVACGADGDEIDKVAFRSGGGVTLVPTSHRFERDVFVRGDGAPLSDHDALAVDFQWTGTVLPTTTTTSATSPTSTTATRPVAVTPAFTG